MAEGRSLLTDTEREVLQQGPDGEGVSSDHYYNVRHRLRERMDKLPGDLAVLKESYPEVWEAICEEVRRSREEPAKEPAKLS